MRLTRFVAGVLSASLLGLVPVALASAPASAADYTTTTSLKASTGLIEFKKGYSPFISGAVTKPDGTGVYYGTVDLMAKPNGAKWRKISTKDASGYVSFSEVIPKKNTQYRLVYNGGASYSDTFQQSSSGTIRVRVARKMTIKRTKNRRVAVFKGRVTPKYKKKKLVLTASKKRDKGYKKVKGVKVRTNKKGRYTVRLPKRKGYWYWRLTAKKDKNYAKNYVGMWSSR